METIFYPPRDAWQELCRRNIPADDAAVVATVERVVADVARRGDAALREYIAMYDGVAGSSLTVSDTEWEEGLRTVDPQVARAIDAAADNIRKFHAVQRPEAEQVETMPMCTPPRPDGSVDAGILYAARVAGVDVICKAGGAHAIAAMAYGTETLERVSKIFGPGNRYVTRAKQLVSAVTAIDMPAGPSEVMILADHTAIPSYVAADMLSQAEHGPDSQSMLVTTDAELAAAVEAEVERLAGTLGRRECIDSSLSHSRIIVVADRDEAVAIANLYAPEHLIVSMADAEALVPRILNAGSVFLGNFSPESAGDYASGTNHTLPTGGWAASMSGVSTESFMRMMTCQQLTRPGLVALSPVITALARAEGLEAHALAVNIRMQ
ncbi:MAG: histidinol dehydrogenase [Muribaculaceae bacterium]|nr:histidinol dehydrogenase [Muribaculaceae bacterium]